MIKYVNRPTWRFPWEYSVPPIYIVHNSTCISVEVWSTWRIWHLISKNMKNARTRCKRWSGRQFAVTLPQYLLLNSLKPSDAYMRQWSNQHWLRLWLVAWSAPSHYQNQCWNIVNKTLRNNIQWNFNRKSNIFIEENTFENVVCEMLFFSSRPQCVKGDRMLTCAINRICHVISEQNSVYVYLIRDTW